MQTGDTTPGILVGGGGALFRPELGTDNGKTERQPTIHNQQTTPDNSRNQQQPPTAAHNNLYSQHSTTHTDNQ
jgi:hypothetical protein